jgi:FkbH-like protein
MAVFLRALLVPPRKCLVLDLDNTLWGGILGEVGADMIKVGSTYPGSAYREFQQALLNLHRRGILLAINSKNNQSEVEEVFRSHPDMVLRPEHFASVRVNWETKPQNMIEIAEELGIGADSLVFFDDNAAECAFMREALPEVLTIQAPPDPLDYSGALLGSAAFERLSFTVEDQNRGQMYREQVERRTHASGAASLEDFLAGLQMTAEIQPVSEFAFPRVVDLLHKTNQFNVTTRRHSAGELRKILSDPHREAFSMRLTDRFGDNGIVGVAILDFQGATAVIDTFLLSCRVIGRAAETALLAFLLQRAGCRGAQALEGVFIPTPKNAPAADFFALHGFARIPHDGNDSRWRLEISQASVAWPAFIADGAYAVRQRG